MTYRPDPDQQLQLGAFVASAAVGALAMYLFDPTRGASRRAAAADTLREVRDDTSRAVSGTVRDLTHRAGAADVFHARDVDHRDDVDELVDRIGTQAARARRLIPQGLDKMFSKSARGMESAARNLREHSRDAETRNAAMMGAGVLGLLSLVTRRSPLTMAVGLAGAALLARGASKSSLPGSLSSSLASTLSDTFHSLLGKGAGADAGPVEIEKTIRIDASPEQVYDLWANYENFPRFMRNVVEVRDLGAKLSHWTVKGPAGTRFEWDSILTEQSRPHRLSWRSVPGGEVEQRGEVRIEAFGGGTRATVRLTYTPPAGAAGQAIASLLGSNPAAELEEDLQRMKRLLERGSLPYSPTRASSSGNKAAH